jgi:fatty acid amide hydrolase 2
MQKINFIEASGLELARWIREKKASSEEVVRAHIKRAQLLNPITNAVVEDRYAQALFEAKAADAAIAHGAVDFAKQRYFGVPHSIKELLAVNGMKCTMGSVHRKDVRSTFDSNALQRIRAEGAILIGTTNVPEAAMWFECDNRVYGPGKNPYDNRRTPGGSSGGEAALIAGGGSPFGVGSDIGGSIRMPAAFCGIFGHKPTEKIVPLTGHYPMTLEVAESFVGHHYPFSVVGPLARKAEDLLFLFDILLGPDGIDRNIDASFKLKPIVKDWSKVKVFTLPNPSFFLTSRTEEDLSEAVVKAGEFFAGLGAEVKEAPKRLLYKSFDHWSTRAWTMEGPTFESYMTGGQHVAYIKEFFNMARGSSHYTFPALLTAWFDQRFSGRDKLVQLTEKLNKFKAHVDELLKDDAILILPPHPRKALVLDSTIYRPFDYTYTAAFNALGYAATVVPMGLSQDGLPLSVQIVARERMDHLTLSTCLPLEKEFGGWVPIQNPISKENL